MPGSFRFRGQDIHLPAQFQQTPQTASGDSSSHASGNSSADRTPVGAHSLAAIPGKEIFDATRPFAVESLLRSWWSVISTLVAVAAALSVAALAPWWPVQLAASVVGGLVLVRAFILYHDHMHGSLLRKSRAAKPVFTVIGLVMLSPPRYWRFSHNFHHGHVGKPEEPESQLATSDLGAFPLMTTEAYRDASLMQKIRYRVVRNPLTLLFASVSIFLVGLTILPLFKDPKKFWDGGVALLLHGAIFASLWVFAGFGTLFFAFLFPYALAAAVGAYLFYAQHNYEEMNILEAEEWSYYRGSLESSSFMRLGRVMAWFTGNIGYHHIHHMNPRIPFYRLPEAMAAVPELQEVGTTSLWPFEMRKCLRLNLWDAEAGKLVGYEAARKKSA